MLTNRSKEKNPSSFKILKTPTKQRKKQFTNSLSDLRYISTLCHANFNGIFNSKSNRMLPPSSASSSKHRSISLSRKNINASISTKCSIDDIKRKTPLSSKYSSNHIIFSKINDSSRGSSTQRIQKLTKSSNLNNIKEYRKVLGALQSSYLIKLNKNLSNNQKESTLLATSIKKLSTYVRSASIEYDRSKETNVTKSNESTKIGIDLQILKMKNSSVDKEIACLKEDINSIKSQINELHTEKKNLENDKSNLDSNIDEIKSKVKELPYMIQRCEEDKKNLRTAIVLVKQKCDEIKAEIYKLDNNKEYLGIDLDAIIGYYQQAQVI